jgi:hypothetical protein
MKPNETGNNLVKQNLNQMKHNKVELSQLKQIETKYILMKQNETNVIT